MPTTRIKDFETDYITVLHERHQDVLDTLRAGKIDDNVMETLKNVCIEVAKKFEK